jgi:hypothetical protein
MAASLGRAGALAEEAGMLPRLGRDLPGWLRRTITMDEAVARVQRRLAGRERSFLATVERAIYDHPRSPYLALLRHVGCELGDLRLLVQQEGIEGALAILASKGVYVSFDEFKGRSPIARGSARFQFTDRDFDSPLVTGHYMTFTGGSRGRPGRVLRPLRYVEELTTSVGASLSAHRVRDPLHAFWLTNPITTMLFPKKLSQPTVLWLHPLQFFPLRARVGAHYFKLLGEIGGSPFPTPTLLRAQDAGRLVRWLERRRVAGREIVVHTIPSSAVRVAVAARELGVDLHGVTFYLQSEPVTRARREHIEASGARMIAIYTSMELSTVGSTCATATLADDYHFHADRFAVVEREREVTPGGPEIGAMLLTTLTDAAAKIGFNTELGDYARFERRACDCLLGEIGLTTHFSEARSFEKLSGEGVTFVRSNVVQILEDVLPRRFGGTALDYQIVEEEATDSSTRLVLRVDPAVGDVDSEALRSVLLAELGKGGLVDRHHAELLRRAGSVRVVRQPPLPTAAGKMLPFQIQRSIVESARR